MLPVKNMFQIYVAEKVADFPPERDKNATFSTCSFSFRAEL